MMLACWLWLTGVVALRHSASTRILPQPVELSSEAMQRINLLQTTFLVDHRADVEEAFRQPCIQLKEEIAFWMNLRDGIQIASNDISIYEVVDLKKITPDNSQKFLVTWFLYVNVGAVSKEEASKTGISWRKSNLPLGKGPWTWTKMLKTTFLVDQTTSREITLTSQHKKMLKEELTYWMNNQQDVNTPINDHDITITDVEEAKYFSAENLKKYVVHWYLTFSNGVVTSETADKNFYWRNTNTFNRHSMVEGLQTVFYFDVNANEHYIVTYPRTRVKQLKERLAAEFELKANDITIKKIENQHVYEHTTGRRYQITWNGRCSQEEANKIIEWGPQENWGNPDGIWGPPDEQDVIDPIDEKSV